MDLLQRLKSRFPEIVYVPDTHFSWSYQTRTIHYTPKRLYSIRGQASLLHETAHAQLNHRSYRYDIELVRLEVAAWEYARQLGKEYGIKVLPTVYNQHLETYRNWLYARSHCPTCQMAGLQNSHLLYLCAQCSTSWQVPEAQQCYIQKKVHHLPTPI